MNSVENFSEIINISNDDDTNSFQNLFKIYWKLLILFYVHNIIFK